MCRVGFGLGDAVGDSVAVGVTDGVFVGVFDSIRCRLLGASCSGVDV
jgi:hypothetical protein